MPRCMNCADNEASRVWAGVAVCAECGKLADVVHNRNSLQMKMLLLVMDDKIRTQLLKGELRPGEFDAKAAGAGLRQELPTAVRPLRSGSLDDIGEAAQPRSGDPAGRGGLTGRATAFVCSAGSPDSV